jgi:lipoyl(octanoyl) transferase
LARPWPARRLPDHRPGRAPDIRNYVRRLEEALIAIATGLGVDSAARVDGRSGVWLPGDDHRPERKIAAIGVRVDAGVTLHGFVLNCNPDLRAFDRIVPCGIRDAGVSSLSAELGRDVGIGEVLEATADAVIAALDGATPIVEHPIVRPGTPPGLALRLHPSQG